MLFYSILSSSLFSLAITKYKYVVDNLLYLVNSEWALSVRTYDVRYDTTVRVCVKTK